MNKKRILFVGETSYALTGYGNYFRNILGLLHKTGKYEIAELACYGHINDMKARDIPWRYYANSVNPDDSRHPEYQQGMNQHGEWRLGRVCLDFKPDYIVSIRDFWVDKFITNHSYRRFFKYVAMPTCDSLPLKTDWVDYYLNIDTVLTYTEWALNGIKQECPKINTFKAAPPTAKTIFTPVKNKERHKKELGLPENSIIIGMVARNQIRKLFPDLIRDFRTLLNKFIEGGKEDIAARTYLYLHTSYPDLHYWELPELIKNAGVASKVLFTYHCRYCKEFFPALFQEAVTFCPHCQQRSAGFPNVADGLSDENLAKVYQLFDIYTHVVTCGGREIPVDEALATGIKTFVSNYSSLEDFVNYGLAEPINISRMWDDIGTGALRSYYDRDDLVNKLYNYISLPSQLRQMEEFKLSKKYREIFSWEKTAQIWEDAFDNTPLSNFSWDGPPQFLNPDISPPSNTSNIDYINWLFTYIGEHEKCDGLIATGLARDLAYEFGTTSKLYGIERPNRDNLFNIFKAIANHKNSMENMRINKDSLPSEDYIDYAHLKEECGVE